MIRIFASHYVPEDAVRAAEIDAAFEHNEAHFEVVRVSGDRPTFDDFIHTANAASKSGDLIVICNSDIGVSKHIELAEKYLDYDTCWCLGRWNKTKEGPWKCSVATDAQDVWVFKAPVKPLSAPFPQGAPGCDNHFAYLLQEAGYKTENPCHSVPCFHFHAADARNYSATKVPGPYRPVRPSKLPDGPEPYQLEPTTMIRRAPEEQRRPFRAILHVALITPDSPQHALRNGLRDIAEEYAEVDWRALRTRQAITRAILDEVNRMKPDLVFMQLQSVEPLGPEELKKIKAAVGRGKVVNWSGDVRAPLPQHYIDNGKVIDCTMMTNMDDVWELRKAGVRAEYLQIGVDLNLYRPPEIRDRCPDNGDIVFLGNNYRGTFPLSNHRIEMVDYLKGRYGDRFKVYGTGWLGAGPADAEREAEVYRKSSIAVVQHHFQRDAYYSDRTLRALACGACVVQHRVPNMVEFKEGEHMAQWETLDELGRTIDALLADRKERVRLTENALVEIKNNSWAARMGDLQTLLLSV